MIQINTDWNQNLLPFAFYYTVEQVSDELIFSCSISSHKICKTFDAFQLQNSFLFAEQLWKKEVIELFLKEEDSNTYFEFHIAPNKKWWAAEFSNYREMLRLSLIHI